MDPRTKNKEVGKFGCGWHIFSPLSCDRKNSVVPESVGATSRELDASVTMHMLRMCSVLRSNDTLCSFLLGASVDSELARGRNRYGPCVLGCNKPCPSPTSIHLMGLWSMFCAVCAWGVLSKVVKFSVLCLAMPCT